MDINRRREGEGKGGGRAGGDLIFGEREKRERGQSIICDIAIEWE